MSIRLKLGFLIFVVSFAFILSIAIYFITTNPIDQIQLEQNSLEIFTNSLNTVIHEAEKFSSTSSMDVQIQNFNNSVKQMKTEFENLSNL